MKKLLLLNLFIGSIAFAQVTDTGDKVGIGTTTPAGKLEVTENSSTDAVALRLTNSGWSSNISTSLEFKTGSLKSVPTSKISSIMNGSGNAGDRLGFFLQENGTNPNNNLLVEKVSILPNGNMGIGTTNPNKKLHVNGIIGVGIMTGQYTEGFRIDYVDGGSGTTTFKNNRWGGDIYFKRNSSLGERTQFLFGGASEHYMNIYNGNNEAKVRFISGGNSFINGGNLGIGTTNPTAGLEIFKSNTNNHALILNSSGAGWGSGMLFKNTVGSIYGIYSGSDGKWHFTHEGQGDRFVIDASGNMGIGTTDTKGFKLGVNGKIAATEVKVAAYANWADFVFKSTYNLPTLKEVEQHIKEKGHLKDIPSAEEVKKDGFFLGEMDSKLLQKIEELTLYTLQQEKKIEELNLLKEEHKLLRKKFDALETLVSKMIEKQ